MQRTLLHDGRTCLTLLQPAMAHPSIITFTMGFIFSITGASASSQAWQEHECNRSTGCWVSARSVGALDCLLGHMHRPAPTAMSNTPCCCP